MKLITQAITLPDRYTIPGETENDRNSLVQSALAITAIGTPEENNLARNVGVELRQYCKDAETVRVALTKPLLAGQRDLKATIDDHLAPVKSELDRLERLASVYLVEQEARIAAEQKARLDLAGEAKTESDFQSVMAEPIAEADRARGQSMRAVMKWEITDLVALYHAKPLCVKLEPRPSMIQELCVPEMPTPGIRCWYENKATFSTR